MTWYLKKAFIAKNIIVFIVDRLFVTISNIYSTSLTGDIFLCSFPEDSSNNIDHGHNAITILTMKKEHYYYIRVKGVHETTNISAYSHMIDAFP